MDNKKIIAVFIIIIAILAVIIGAVLFSQGFEKQDSKVLIRGNTTIYEKDPTYVKLIDLNKTPIENETVDVVITDKDGKIVLNKSVTTNSKGMSKIDLDLKKGKYTVNATFSGNDKYVGNNTTQKLTIKEAVTESVSQESYSSSSSSSDSGGYDRYSQQYGTYIKQYTDSNGVQHIEGANGMHESYDPSTGMLSGTDAKGNEYQDHMG